MSKGPVSTLGERVAHRILLQGVVQGVGFRPFVYRLATSMNLAGFVMNTPKGLVIEVEGKGGFIDRFVERLDQEKPPRARIDHLVVHDAPVQDLIHFEIKISPDEGPRALTVPPDVAVCADCLQEIFNPLDRRFLYPFTNCTNCGPRYSILQSLPYDRKNTTMVNFNMCVDCEKEYTDPNNRRFHAQPNACPACGPHLELWDEKGNVLSDHQNALDQGCELIRQGKILALKGVGGFHLIVDAKNTEAIQRLRAKKNRPFKPLALLYPSLEMVKQHCIVSPREEQLLLSHQAPIVILQRGTSLEISPLVAPHNQTLGVMLPYSPLHAILMQKLHTPIVATSGNLSEDPICTDEKEALTRLNGIADAFLVHNRPIARSVDDSVFHVVLDRPAPLRLSRGYSPFVLETGAELPSGLAVGGHLKNTVAVLSDGAIALSQHIGDLDSLESRQAFEKAQESMKSLYEIEPTFYVCDAHPDYASTQWVENQVKSVSTQIVRVQHHHAHIASCMAEHKLVGPVLGVAFDGSGYGPDKTVWGGEFLLADENTFTRFATFRTFQLPGGEQAVQEPRRVAFSLLEEVYGEFFSSLDFLPPLKALSMEERTVLHSILKKNINSPMTSSMGRIYDAISSLLGFTQTSTFEGEAAIELEQACDLNCELSYDLPLQRKTEGEPEYYLDWEPMVRALVEDIRNNLAPSICSAKFHNALTQAILAVAKQSKNNRIVLSGGCFQNRVLLSRTVDSLRREQLQVYWNEQIPCNDGGLAVGQAFIAAHKLKGEF